MKPLYIWAGGKNKMIKKYLATPGLPTTGFDTYVEPFFGGGAMMLWVYENCPDVKRFIMNDIKSEIVGIYTAIKTDPESFTNHVDSLQEKYIALDKAGRKEFYYELRDDYINDFAKWDSIKESAILYFMMKTGFNGIWQVNKASKGRFATPVGLCNQKETVYDKKLVAKWHDFLQLVEIHNGDWYDACKDVESDTGTFFFMDPPYRDSFTSYGEGFSDADQTKLIDFCKQRDQQGDTVFYCNRNGNDGFFEMHQGNLNMQLYDITYTAGRRKQEEDGGHSAKKAEEVLLHSDISLQTNTTFDILFEKV